MSSAATPHPGRGVELEPTDTASIHIERDRATATRPLRRPGTIGPSRRSTGGGRRPILVVALAVACASTSGTSISTAWAAAPGHGTVPGRAHSSRSQSGAGGTAGPPAAELSLVIEPQQGYGRIDALLASPRRELDLTMYELRDPKAEQILVTDARRGVRVRVLLDRDYIGEYNQAALSFLGRNGVAVRWASDEVAITHQKSFVIDRRTAVVMTGNLTSEYYSTGRDFAVTDSVPADVAAIETTFALDWADRRGTSPDGSDLVWSPGSEQTLLSLIASAHRTLLIENEEMRAPPIVAALETAARRGVEVKLVMTRAQEWSSDFDALARAGVDVRTYSSSAALYIHAKVIDADDRRVFIGSQNFSTSSLLYNRELGLITTDATILGAIGATLTSDYDNAQPWSP